MLIYYYGKFKFLNVCLFCLVFIFACTYTYTVFKYIYIYVYIYIAKLFKEKVAYKNSQKPNDAAG